MNFDPSLLYFLIAVIIAGLFLLISITAAKKRRHNFDKENYQSDFLCIENSLTKDNDASYAMAIIKGDKLLDKALCEMGLAGRTMGDRLKKLDKERLPSLNSVWHAHKLRNQIAHEMDFSVSYDQAKHALGVYKNALRELGAI